MIQEFIEFARARAPAKHQKAFKRDLETWYLGLPIEEKNKVTKAVEKGSRLKSTHWTALAYQMLDLFHKRGATSG